MVKRILFLALVSLMLQSVVVLPARADWRPYAYSYAYGTAYGGEKELELYTDYDFKGRSFNLKNQIEFEYGFADNFMVSLYGVFSGSDTTNYRYKETKLESRYRFGEAGQYMVDPAIYFELKTQADGSFNTVEFKGILSKDVGDWNITTNLSLEKDLIPTADWEKEYTLGMGRQLSNSLKGALEVVGTVSDAPTLYIGPSASLIWNQMKMNLALGIGATPASQLVTIRNIVSYEF